MNRPILHAVVILTGLTAFPSVGMAQNYSWNGLGGDGNWSTSGNWVGGTAPYASASRPSITLQPVSQRTTTLDQNLAINALTINADGYTVANANAAVLSIGNPTVTNNVWFIVANGAGGTISAPIVLNGGTGMQDFIQVNVNANLNLAGPVSTNGSQGLIKTGGGLLHLSGDNSGFTAPITVDRGTLRIGSANALGSLSAGTTVRTLATLDLNGQNGIDETLTLNGFGHGGDGALINSSETTSRINGPVQLDSDASIGGSGRIEFKAAIIDFGSGHNLTKSGTGALVFLNPSGNSYRGSTTISAGTLVVSNSSGSGTGIGTGAAAAVSINNGGRLAGDGIVTQAVTANDGGTIRGGDPLVAMFGTNRILRLNGGTTLSGGSTIQTAIASSGGAVNQSSLIQFASGFNLGTSGNPLTAANQLHLNVTMESGSGLTFGQPRSIILATGTGGITLNGAAAPSTIDPNLFTATFGFEVLASSISLTTTNSNLVLTFTPVPEPTAVLVVVAAGLGVGRWYRRRR